MGSLYKRVGEPRCDGGKRERDATSLRSSKAGAPSKRARRKLQWLPCLPQKSWSFTSTIFYSLEANHQAWRISKEKGVRLYLLVRGVLRNFWTPTPPAAPFFAWAHVLIFFPRLMDLQKQPTSQNPEQLQVILENLLVLHVEILPNSDQETGWTETRDEVSNSFWLLLREETKRSEWPPLPFVDTIIPVIICPIQTALWVGQGNCPHVPEEVLKLRGREWIAVIVHNQRSLNSKFPALYCGGPSSDF